MAMKTTIFHKLLPAIVLLAGLSACQDDDSGFRPSVADGDGMTLEFISDPMQKISVTRASDPKDDDEKRISTLYVFFFGADGKLLDDKVTVGDHSPFTGYAAINTGETVLKIDKAAVAGNEQASSVTVYAVANISELEALEYFGEMVDAGNGLQRPSKINTLADVESIVYRRDEVSVGIPEINGVRCLPMVGKKSGINLASPDVNHAEIDMFSLMARVDVNISINSDHGDNTLPRLTMMSWEAVNLPKQVTFGDPEAFDGDRTTGDLGDEKETVSSPLQQQIYNRNGEISFSFYMFENIQQRLQEAAWPDGVTIDPATGYPSGVYDPAHGIDKRQNYKPYFADGDNAANIVLHTYYTDYNGKTTEVDYTLYLGANHTDDFSVKRNHQYKNDITIKGLTQVGNNPEHITFDARVNIYEDSNNNYHLAILRERDHDAHFCVTPMDVYMFGDNNGTSAYDPATDPSIEVILGDCGDSGETPSDKPDWIAMELIPAANMAAGTVPSTTVETGNALLPTNEPWHAGNGKRSWFTTSLVSDLNASNNGRVTVTNSRDRIYFYIDENLTMADRTATVTVIYKEGGTEVRRSTMQLAQVHLLPVALRDNKGTIYMEQFEEYLDHYDPLDEHRSEQLYDGLEWAKQGTALADQTIEQLYGGSALGAGVTGTDAFESPALVINDGLAYTSFLIYRSETGQAGVNLNSVPQSAAWYCFNKNKRNTNGEIPTSYRRLPGILGAGDGYEERSNQSKWFLPGIRQMEDALTQYYQNYQEFQDYYYWSCSAGEAEGRGGSGQSSVRARATKVQPNGGYYESGGGSWIGQYAYELGNGGYAKRTEVLRIRAFRTDLNGYGY